MADPSATIAVFNDRTIAALFGPVRKDLDMEALARRLAARQQGAAALVDAQGLSRLDAQLQARRGRSVSDRRSATDALILPG